MKIDDSHFAGPNPGGEIAATVREEIGRRRAKDANPQRPATRNACQPAPSRDRKNRLDNYGYLRRRARFTGGTTAIGRIGCRYTAPSSHEGAPANGTAFPEGIEGRDRATSKQVALSFQRNGRKILQRRHILVGDNVDARSPYPHGRAGNPLDPAKYWQPAPPAPTLRRMRARRHRHLA